MQRLKRQWHACRDGAERRAKQDAVNLACILQRQTADLWRQREHDVEVRDGQQFGFPSASHLVRAIA